MQAISRRRALAMVGALGCGPYVAAAQPGGAAPLTVAQLFDSSAAQLDVAKDFVIGSRAFWQDRNSRGGLRGRPVNHMAIEVDGSTPQAVRAAVLALRDNPACVMLSGTAGDPLATQVARVLRQENIAIAHAAPWLQNSTLDVDERTFPIFAARQEQIAHAMRSLSVMGVHEIGAIYATSADHALYHDDMDRTAAALKLKVTSFRADADLTALGQKLTPGTPAILLFVGGTPELVQFTQGLEKQQRQRYVIALADVNLQTLMQMGGAKSTPVVVTQAVPLTTAPLPVVRHYRDALAKLFDEPPAPLSLAGFIAARYAYEVLREIDNPSRATVLATFQRRQVIDLGGYAVAFDARRRAGTYVTQSMLTQDGRVIG